MIIRLLATALVAASLSGCLESSVKSGVDTAVSGNPPVGETAMMLLNGNSRADYANFWHCGAPATEGSFDIMFGADGSGLFKFWNDIEQNMIWDVNNEAIVFALDNFIGTTALANPEFLNQHHYRIEFILNNENYGRLDCRRYDLNGSLIENDQAELPYTNGADALNIDNVWSCRTSAGVGIGLLLYEDRMGGYSDSTDSTFLDIESWRTVQSGFQMDFSNGTSGSFRNTVFQDNNNFTAEEVTRATGSYGAATCIRIDENGDPIQRENALASLNPAQSAETYLARAISGER